MLQIAESTHPVGGVLLEIRLRGKTEGYFDESKLLDHVDLRQPPHLSLPDHMNCFIALDRAPRSIKRAEAEFGVDPSLDGAMILFDDVVEVRNGTAATASTQGTDPLQLLNDGWIGRISIHRDNARPRMTRRGQSLLEEASGRSQVPRLRKQEIDRGTGGIDGAIEVRPVAGNSNISFVGPPRAIRGFHLAADSLVQFRCVALYPSPNGGVVDRQIALAHQFFQITITERKA